MSAEVLAPSVSPPSSLRGLMSLCCLRLALSLRDADLGWPSFCSPLLLASGSAETSPEACFATHCPKSLLRLHTEFS